MDCDYDPAEHQRQKEERRKRKGKQPSIAEKDSKSKKSAFYESVAKEKPVFDPSMLWRDSIALLFYTDSPPRSEVV